MGSGWRSATGPTSARTSETSRTRSANDRGPLGVPGVVREQVGILLHRRAAPRGVDDDGVDALSLEGVDQRPGEALGLGRAPVVRRESAAAALRRRGDHVEALRGEDAGRGGIDTREELALHAAEQHPDRPAARPPRGGALRHPLGAPQRRCKSLHGGKSRRDALQHNGSAQRVATGRSIWCSAERSAHSPEPSRVREQREDRCAQRALRPRALEPALHLAAGRLDELVVPHT